MNELKGNDILNILLDENNKEDIVLNDIDGKKIVFEQLITIPYYEEYLDKEEIYCILHPKMKSKEFEPDFVYPFKVIKLDDNNYTLQAEDDEEIISYLNAVYMGEE